MTDYSIIKTNESAPYVMVKLLISSAVLQDFFLPLLLKMTFYVLGALRNTAQTSMSLKKETVIIYRLEFNQA